MLRVPSNTPKSYSPDVMSLLCFPNELLLIVAENLDTKDLNSLLKTCRHLAALLTPLLRKIAFQDKDGTTALHWAAAKGHGPLVTLLLENGAAIDGQDTSGRAPLQCAVEGGHVETVRLLLDHGAEFPVSDPRVKIALHCAARYGNVVVLQELLVKGGGRITRESVVAAHTNEFFTAVNVNQQHAAILLRNKIPKTMYSEGREIVHQAVAQDYRKAVELLKGNGVSSSPPKGETPLDRALKCKSPFRVFF